MKKVFLLCFLFIGTVCGAGFSSGREILTFFSGNLAFAPLAVFACGAVFFFAVYTLLSLASKIKVRDISSLSSHFPQKIQTPLEVVLAFCLIIICSVMLAGADTVFGDIRMVGFSSLILFFLGTLVALSGKNGLFKVNFILVPILLIFIVSISAFHISKSGGEFISFSGGNYLSSIFSGVSYSSMNMLLSAVLLLSLGGRLKHWESLLVAVLSASVFCGVILVFLFAISTDQSFLSAQMPILQMANSISPILQGVASVAIWVAIFTTFCSSLFSLLQYSKNIIKSPAIRISVLFLLCYPLSRIGFAGVIAIFFPAMGFVGIFIIAYCFFLNQKLQNQNKKSQQQQHFSADKQ